VSCFPAAYNAEYSDYTTTNNCSQGLDLRSTSRHDGRLPVPSSTRVLSPPARRTPPVKMEIDDSRDAKLPLNLASGGGAEMMMSADKVQYIDQWCEDQRQFTKCSSVNTEAAGCYKLSTCDKLLKRITHPFTQADKKRLENIVGRISHTPTSATLTEVQRSDFVQGGLLSCICIVNVTFCGRIVFCFYHWTGWTILTT